jgi:hypothetical protein
MAGPHGIEDAIRAAATPSWSEIVRAKREILELLADGEPHGIGSIQGVLHLIDDVPVHLGHRPRIEVPSASDIQRIVTSSHPIFAHYRLAWAATEALVDLIALGLVVEVVDPPTYESSHPLLHRDGATIGYQVAGHGAGAQLQPPLPPLGRAYRLVPRHRERTPWFADPDLFAEDLDELNLDVRARRCIDEALAAYRRGLYLACTSLLGAASEAAWYAAGSRLRHLDDQLDKAIDNERTAKVITRVTEVLRQLRPLGSAADDLASTAALLRDLRNYGAHPRPDDTTHLERYFSEAPATVLLLETHNYLTRLSGAVAARLASVAD